MKFIIVFSMCVVIVEALESVRMFTVSKALFMSKATSIVHAVGSL